MLNKKNAATLKVLNILCEDSSYKVLELGSIKSKFPNKSKISNFELEQSLEFLKAGGYIDIKYAEENTYCLAVCAKGRMILEESLFESNTLSRFSKLLIFTSLSSGVMAFLGAMLAILLLK